MKASTFGKLIKNPLQIIQIMGSRRLLDWMPDSLYIKLTYRAEMHKKLQLNNPKTFNEKLQWLKCYDHDNMYSKYIDKIQAKKIVGNLIGEEHIVPTLGKWKNAEEIDYDLLPDKFVLKCNHDQGSVIIVRNKNNFDRDSSARFLNSRLKSNWYYGTREYGYKNISPMIFAEQFLQEDIIDYKFYCFHGEPRFLYCGKGLTIDHSLKIDFYDLDWKRMPFYRTDYDRLGEVEKPANLDAMADIARLLSKDFIFVRVDLFDVGGQVYFSELTFCPASGFMPFVPEEYDAIVGEWLNLET